jgi:hypothetical protein
MSVMAQLFNFHNHFLFRNCLSAVNRIPKQPVTQIAIVNPIQSASTPMRPFSKRSPT